MTNNGYTEKEIMLIELENDNLQEIIDKNSSSLALR